MRLLEGAERAKIALSADTEAAVQIDNVFEECEIDDELSRDKMDELIQPLKEKLEQLLIETKRQLSEKEIELSQIDRVELLGDNTRIELFSEAIKAGFEQPQLNRTMHS